MALNVQEQGKIFEFTEKIGKALYVAKIVLRQSYIMKTEFVSFRRSLILSLSWFFIGIIDIWLMG